MQRFKKQVMKQEKHEVALVTESVEQTKFKTNKDKITRTENATSKPDYKKKNRKCFNCGNKCHYKSECRQPKKKGSDENFEEGFVEAEVMVASSESVEPSSWIIDFGATHHMTPDRSNFNSYKKLDQPVRVRFGKSQMGLGIGIGQLKLVANVGSRVKYILLGNVIHVPQMGRKLISVGAATSNGIRGFVNSESIILRNKHGVAQLIGVKKGNLFVAKVKEAESHNTVVEEEEHAGEGEDISEGSSEETECENLSLWHERLAHLHKQAIAKMAKSKAVNGLENLKITSDPKSDDRRVIDRKSCCLGKQVRRFFPRSERDRSNKVGERVHTDLCGPISTPSLRRQILLSI